MKKIRSIGIFALVILWAGLALSLWFGPKEDYTYSERRKLAQMPSITVKTVFDAILFVNV